MYEPEATKLETIFRYSGPEVQLFTLQWAGRDYAIRQVKNIQIQKGAKLRNHFWATDGTETFEVTI